MKSSLNNSKKTLDSRHSSNQTVKPPFKFSKTYLCVLTAFWTILCCGNFYAQKSTTAILGRVYDQQEAAVIGATVTLKQNGAKTERSVATDKDGAFRLDNVLLADYLLKISADGFAPTELKLQLAANPKRDFEVRLQPEGVSEVVTVIEATAELNADVATSGTKMEMALRDVPQSIQVVTSKMLEKQQAVTLADAVRNVSGVTQAPTFFGHSNHFTMRGFELDLANSYFRDGFKYDQLGFQENADVEQVEVLKGPASVLYGRSEPGGIVNIVSKNPREQHYVSIGAQTGSYRFFRPTIDASGPLNKSKTLLYRFNGVWQNSDSFRDFVYQNRLYAAPQVLWKIGDNTNINFDAAFMRETGHPDYGIVGQDGKPVDVPWRRNFSEPWGKYLYQSRQGGYMLNHVFNADWRLRNAFRYTSFNWYYYDTYQSYFAERDRLVRFIEDYDYPRRNLSSQTELVGAVKTFGIEHKLLFGFETARNINMGIGSYAEVPPINIFNVNYLERTAPPAERYINPDAPGFDRVNYKAVFDTVGGFVQDQIILHPKVKLLVGARVESYTSRIKSEYINYLDEDLRQKDFAVSPRAGAVYQPTQHLSFYFSYSKSFSPSYPTQVQEGGAAFEPTFGEQYEGGLKADFFNRRLSGTLAYFDISKTNVIVTDPNNPRNSIQVGAQKAQGFETDLSVRLKKNWNLLVAYALTRAYVNKDTTFLVGSIMPNSARHVGSIWTDYEFNRGALNGLSLNFGVSGQSKRPTSLTVLDLETGAASTPIMLPGFTRADMGVSYSFKKSENIEYKFQVKVKNIFDKRYYESGRSDYLIMLGAPRTVLAGFQVSFK